MIHRAPIWGRHRFIPGFLWGHAPPRHPQGRPAPTISNCQYADLAGDRIASGGIKFLQVHRDPAAPAPTFAKLSISALLSACY